MIDLVALLIVALIFCPGLVVAARYSYWYIKERNARSTEDKDTEGP